MNSINKIDNLFKEKKENILSIFFTAGFPKLDDTTRIILELQNSGVDMIEVGFPFSDPLADGPIIQNSGQVALDNGMTLKLVFEQLNSIKEQVNIPLILMGYINPVMQMGVDTFLENCVQSGVSGVILPDVPLELWENEWSAKFDAIDIYPILLITPQTSDERAKRIDNISKGFVYLVASSGTTGRQHDNTEKSQLYFKRIKNLGLKNPLIAGFGIHNKASFNQACSHTNGAIIGSAFVKKMGDSGLDNIYNFVQTLK